MAATTKKKLEEVLTVRLALTEPEFYLEKLPGGKLSGSVVSDTFEGSDNVARQQSIWDALEQEFGPESQNIVGTLLAYTKAEWHVPLQGDRANGKRRKSKSL